ncbi:MAG TPA: SDR family NAD(P)-dependent oxidoreductase [Actinomycetota bacterium]|nr:SDR family NAD(P)-dependent oxidoreductase [Actinomycetota bacterium]
MRLKDKVVIVTGAGQTPGETIGNGRATAILFAREGARVLVVDRDIGRARETETMIAKEGGTATIFEADVTREDDCHAITAACVREFGRIYILHNNVGIGTGDAGATHLELDAWKKIIDVNLTGAFLACKHVLPQMREQGSGSIINISSLASIAATGMLAYKVSKAGLNALTQQIAMGNAKYGIRCNAILPGLMNTPMAIEGFSEARGIPKDQLISARDSLVPLRGKQGTAWDVAYAALFLASDEARFITGVLLPVDGGQSVKVG